MTTLEWYVLGYKNVGKGCTKMDLQVQGAKS